ncbi:hypothetical protein EJ07DRAFT_155255 [Lizonia empirigonia]|nr:hypothetical protein EJ07DRAFT_155255 [Lizonia empirigonia]
MHKSKSRIRFQGRKKKAKQDDLEEKQHKPVCTVYSGASGLVVGGNMITDEPLFTKKRVPSTDELGALLRSNLSSSLAVAKASTTKEKATHSLPTPSSILAEQFQDSDHEPSKSFLELAPLYRPVNDRLEATISGDVGGEEGAPDGGPSASLLATTAIYRPVDNHCEPASSCVATSEHADEDNRPPTSLLAATQVLISYDHQSETTAQNVATAAPAVECRTIKFDNRSPTSIVNEARETRVNYIKPVIRSRTVPLEPRNLRPTFLQKVVTLFAGRRRSSLVIKDRSRSEIKHSDTQSILSPAPRTPIPPKNLPLSPPVVVSHRPYQPLEENLRAPFIEPAKGNKYTGDYSVLPDTFEPAEVQHGFASKARPVSPPILPIRRQNSDGILLDRNKTAWGKWYSKISKPEDLPFAKLQSSASSSQLDKELTEQSAWDAHRTSLVQPRLRVNEHMSDIDMARDAEDNEQERAARLRYHPGHCFGAVTGCVYPFQAGLII